jgi:hypothetical protein
MQPSCITESAPTVARPTLGSSVRHVDEVADLAAIFESAANVVVLRRRLGSGVTDDVDRLVGEVGFGVVLAVANDAELPRKLAGAFEGWPHLARDVATWAGVVADLSGSARVGIRLVRTDVAMCPRLHVDRVTLRAVCAYRGMGTEFAASEDVDRRWLGHAAEGRSDAESGLLRAPGCIQAAGEGDVVLLKGEEWPGNARRGAVHRSPAASPAHPRVVLTIDPL